MLMMLKCALFFLLAVLVSGCAHNLYFGTATSVGLDVAGTTKIPSKIAFAYDRSEIAIVPDNQEGDAHSVFASLDSEWTWFNGFFVKQNFATGQAAEIAAADTAETQYDLGGTPRTNKPLIFTTGTRLGIDLSFGHTANAPASLLIGYKRGEMSLIPDVADKTVVDPVYADIVIAGYDAEDNSIPDQKTMLKPRLGGVRIQQRFATGKAAIDAANNRELRAKLREAVLGNAANAAMADGARKFRTVGTVLNTFDRMHANAQAAYLEELNQQFNRGPFDAANLQSQLSKLDSEQVEKALQLLNP